MRPGSVSGTVYLDSPTPKYLAEYALRETSYGAQIPASVAVHHEAVPGVAVVLAFPDRNALRSYAAELIRLADALDVADSEVRS
jgi:hypothetical protein